MGSTDLVRELQERAASAQPAEHVAVIGGWRLRYSSNNSWWLSSALPNAPVSAPELPGRIDLVEAFYAAQGSIARFQITPGVCASGVESFLEHRGYRRHDPVSLQIAATRIVADSASSCPFEIRLNVQPVRAWIETWRGLHEGGDISASRVLLDRVRHTSVYASAFVKREVVGIARAVLDTEWVGVFDMGTLPTARRQGIARGLLAGLASWAIARQAESMYLQVELDNDPALGLYAAAGFNELTAYHYLSAANELPTAATQAAE